MSTAVSTHTRAVVRARLRAPTRRTGPYSHVVEVAVGGGGSGTAAHLMPLSVDGTVVAASVCLVELNGRLRALALTTTGVPAAEHAVPDVRQDAAEHHAAHNSAEGVVAVETGHEHEATRDHGQDHAPRGVDVSTPRHPGQHDGRNRDGRTPHVTRDAAAAAVARIRRTSPSLTAVEIAARVDVHPSTVRRHLAAPNKTTTNTTTASAQAPTTAAPTRTDAIDVTTDTDATAPVVD